MKKQKFIGPQRPANAISTVAIVVIIVVVIVVAGVGAYVALGSSTSTTTSSSTTSQTTTRSSTTSSSTTQATSTSSTSSGFTLPSSLPSETVTETGSSLLYPLFNLWVPNFTGLYSNVKINTASTGSGTGQSDAEQGVVQIGSSDAYLTNTQASANPNILNIPLAISAQQINYNLPMIPASTHLNFSGPVLAGIYNGSITQWNDPQIKALQSASVASMLPSNTIIPIHRSDGSGDTFIFTSYLSFTTKSWNTSVGYATSVSWPAVPSAQSANGNGGMVTASHNNEYSIAYIGVSFLLSAESNNLGYAYLKNQAGNFVNITQSNIQAAANSLVSSTSANERVSLVFAPGANSYPIINYEYAMVSKVQNATGMALVLRTLLGWALQPNYGNAPHFLNQVNFVALPPSVVQLSMTQIAEISGP